MLALFLDWTIKRRKLYVCDNQDALKKTPQIPDLLIVYSMINTTYAGSVPELSFLPASFRGWTRAGEKRPQLNLLAHVQNETNQKLLGPKHAARVNVSRNAFFSALKKKTFSLTLISWYKNVKIETWFIVACTLIYNEYASLLFSWTFFSYCFCMISGFAKVFERKV